jgi:hypothetical protein
MKTSYPQDFENLWAIYPKRAGGNPKKKAYKAYCARLEEAGIMGMIIERIAIHRGLQRYKAFCEATGKVGTEFIMQACTFFGPDEHYEEKWDIPVENLKLPPDDNDLWKFAKDNGLQDPGDHDNYYQYRQKLMDEIRSR